MTTTTTTKPPPLLAIASPHSAVRHRAPSTSGKVDKVNKELAAVKAWSMLLASCARRDGRSEGSIAALLDVPGLPKLLRRGFTIEDGLAQIRELDAALALRPACSALPERLRDARNRAGLSARALDRAAGLKPGHVARIERGSDVQLSTATALAEALGVRVDWLATGSLPQRWALADVVSLAEWRERRAR